MDTWEKQSVAAVKDFDVQAAQLDPATVLYDWAAQFLGVPIKQIYVVQESVSPVRLGGFLTGLKKAMSQFQQVDVRSITYEGKEEPPRYEVIQLNSQSSDTFLRSGTAFLKGPGFSLMVNHEPEWTGECLTFFAPLAAKDSVNALIEGAWTWAKNNNFLKGESFSVSGEFLKRTDESWGDLFLEPDNEKALRRALDRFNEKGSDFANHGMILCGPPGTGKTLSGRITLNERNGTFIWLAAKDFYRLGSFGGLASAFAMARELAPAVLFLEDVDNWLDDWSVDFLKSEMDGIAQSAGVLTMLTTNFPERLPKELIDRPGRFHDVLKFDLPSATVRQAMLEKWLPGLATESLHRAVSATDGMAGAHLFHLSAFAKSIQEAEGKTLEESVDEAIKKTLEQRELIGSMRANRFRANGPLWTRGSTRRSWIGKRETAEEISAKLLAGFYAGKQLSWETLQSVNNELGKAISLVEIRAAAEMEIK